MRLENADNKNESAKEELEAYGKKIFKGACVVVAGGLVAQFLFGESKMEPILDVAHSAYCVHQCARAALTLHYENGLLVVDENGAKFISNSLCTTLGYFACDIVFIAINLGKGNPPRLWKEKLAHHILSFYANFSVLSFPEKSFSGRAERAATTFAYLAENSQMYLRLASITTGKLHRMFERAALFNFLIFRVMNGLWCIYVLHKLKPPVVTPTIRACNLIGGTATYVLNLFWFYKLIQRERKYWLQYS